MVSFLTVTFSKFLSTPSARRATHCPVQEQARGRISIHALREEGDYPVLGYGFHQKHFYPRPPRGGRLVDLRSLHSCQIISIHALREEGDRS